MKSICFIVPYFTRGKGKLPQMFELWLESCKGNSTINWIVFTDCDISTNPPANVEIIRTSFEQIVKRIQKIMPFKIRLETPYKLCDFKVTYGEAFSDYLKEYDFWGFCDIDLIWGDIRKYITDEVLNNYDRILSRGHCSIFRNDLKINCGYRTLPNKQCLDYKMVFTSPQSFAFDEWAEHIGGGVFQDSEIKWH